MLSHFSRVWLFMTLWTIARQAPLSMGFSRQEYWNRLLCPPPGDLSRVFLNLQFWLWACYFSFYVCQPLLYMYFEAVLLLHTNLGLLCLPSEWPLSFWKLFLSSKASCLKVQFIWCWNSRARISPSLFACCILLHTFTFAFVVLMLVSII